MCKEQNSPEKVFENVQKLRADLWKKCKGRSALDPETKIALMVNQCVFGNYEEGLFK